MSAVVTQPTARPGSTASMAIRLLSALVADCDRLGFADISVELSDAFVAAREFLASGTDLESHAPAASQAIYGVLAPISISRDALELAATCVDFTQRQKLLRLAKTQLGLAELQIETIQIDQARHHRMAVRS